MLQAIACWKPEIAEAVFAAILQILLCLSLNTAAPGLAGMLDLPKESCLPLGKANLMSMAHLVWSHTGDSQCTILAIKVIFSCFSLPG